MSSMHKFSLACALLAIALHVEAASTRRVRVQLNKPCTNAKGLNVVLNGADTQPFALEPEDESKLVWLGQWKHADPLKTFDAEASFASLRLGGMRTDCRKSYKDPKKGPVVALFTFDCNDLEVADVKITVEPDDMKVHYKRRLPRVDDVEASVECIETGLINEAWTIADVRRRGEILTLYIGVEPKDPSTPGFQPPMERLGREGLRFTRAGIVQVQAAQRVRGDQSPPNVSPNAYDIDIELANRSGLNELRVKKVE